MTNLEALQSLVEYENSALFEKVLLEHGLTSSDNYNIDNKKEIDLCLADIYFHLAGNPDVKEGSQTITYDRVQLIAMAKAILIKYDEDPANIDGTSKW